MSSLNLLGLSYQKFYHPFTNPRLDIKEVFDILLEKLTNQINEILSILPEEKQKEIGKHFICSTIVTSCFANGDVKWEDMKNIFKSKIFYGYPNIFLTGYECASWGYSLRYFFKKYPDSRYVMITIFDINVYNYEFWVYNPNWEYSGFGATTILIEKNDAIQDELITGSAYSFNALMDFAKALRRDAEKRKNNVIALPFFPKNIRMMLETIFKNFDILPDDHPKWGHCFGNDPWLSIILHNKERTNMKYLAASFALNGYFSILDINLTPETKFILINEK